MAKKKVSSRNQDSILGVSVDSIREDLLLEKIGKYISKDNKFYIVTPNPEIILLSQRDKELKKILNSADFKVADGVGLKLANPTLEIIPGRRLMLKLFELADQKQLKVYLFGSSRLVIAKAIARIKVSYPNILIDGHWGPQYDSNGNPVSEIDTKIELDIVNTVKKIKPDIIFVALGAPKQEKWIEKWRNKLPIKLMMVVGGSLDYFAGVKQTPPSWLAKVGLEWLWRMMHESGHYKRVLNAVLVFPLGLIKEKLT